MTCLLRKSSLLTFTICANRLPRHEGQLTTFNHFDRRLRECSLASLRWIVVSTGGATDSQKLSMNSLKTIVVLPRLLQQTRGRVSRKSPAYHIDDRADGLERGGHPLMNSLPKASDHFLRICRAVEVANTTVNTLGFQIASPSSTAISTFQPTPPPAVPLWTLEFQPRGPCGSPGAGWRPWPPLDPPFRLHARPGKAVFCTGLHAPEVHPAPLSVTTGGSSSSQPTPKKM